MFVNRIDPCNCPFPCSGIFEGQCICLLCSSLKGISSGVATLLTIVSSFLGIDQNTGAGLQWPCLNYVTLSLQPRLINPGVGGQLTQAGPIILSLLLIWNLWEKHTDWPDWKPAGFMAGPTDKALRFPSSSVPACLWVHCLLLPLTLWNASVFCPVKSPPHFF